MCVVCVCEIGGWEEAGIRFKIGQRPNTLFPGLAVCDVLSLANKDKGVSDWVDDVSADDFIDENALDSPTIKPLLQKEKMKK